MRVWLFSHLQNSPGNQIFRELAVARGHLVEEIRPGELSWRIRSGSEGARLEMMRAESLVTEQPELVFARAGASAPESALDELTALEALGVAVVNRAEALQRCREKITAHLYFARRGVPTPATLLGPQAADWATVVEVCGPPPHVVKLSSGTKGEGVILTESRRSLSSVVGTLQSRGVRFLVQRFIREAAGSDLRLFLVGGRVLGAARRQAQGDEFRSNLHLCGRAEEVEPSVREIEVAEAAAAAIGVEVAGVDLLRSESGPLVLEVNGSPGLEASPRFGEGLWDYLEARTQGRRQLQRPTARPG